MLRRVSFGLVAGAWAVATAVACGGSDGTTEGEALADGGSTTGADAAGELLDGSPAPPDGGPTGNGDPDGGADADAGPAPIVTSTFVTSITAGADRACAVQKTGALLCWGGFEAPATVDPGSTWKQASTGGVLKDLAGCGIKADGTLWCWTSAPFTLTQPVAGTFDQVGVGPSVRCAVSSAGELFCWGTNNLFGQLGVGDTNPRGTPTKVGDTTDWAKASPGVAHTCALKKNGSLWCWGWNAFGQVGDGTADQRNAPVEVQAGTTFTDLDATSYQTCAVRSDGALLCWGSNVKTPTRIDQATDWKRVAVGTSHVCALKTTGTVHCWGQNDREQLGLPLAAGNFSRSVPTQLGVASDWDDLAAGDAFTCATKKGTGTVWCWGSSSSGQLALPPYDHASPKRVGAAGEFAYVGVGANDVCAVRKNGQLACWGKEGGLPTTGLVWQTPVTIGAASNWKTVKPGYVGACATNTSGLLHCWNTGGTPTSLALTVSAYDVGYSHQCAISGGSLYCWGDNIFNKAGGVNNGLVATPTKVGTETWSSVAANFDSTCAVRADGTMWCMGFAISTGLTKVGTATTWNAVDRTPGTNNGWFGILGGKLQNWVGATTPLASGVETDWTHVAAGVSHVCGIRTGGTLWCKGDNSYGQLGLGKAVPGDARFDPAQVGSATDWVAVSAGNYSTCALRASGDLYCWGSNDYGEAGDGSAFRSTPTVVP